ncbi:hypothetical protein [Rathayibacter tritici]|uniref:hypothetical protein n=1 Tax=Rathayibacter tritici TaxID=33888 RepID=UPI000AC4E533|nr:hypothetical protein [Rathayibacter tritici]
MKRSTTAERVMSRISGAHEHVRLSFAASGWGAILASVLLLAGSSLTVIDLAQRLIRAVQSEQGDNIATMASGMGAIGIAGVVASALGWAVLAAVFVRRTSKWTFAAVGIGISLLLLFGLQIAENHLLRIGVCLGLLFLSVIWPLAGGATVIAKEIQHAFFAFGFLNFARMAAAAWATEMTPLAGPVSVLLGISLCAGISALLVLVRTVVLMIRATPDLRRL